MLIDYREFLSRYQPIKFLKSWYWQEKSSHATYIAFFQDSETVKLVQRVD